MGNEAIARGALEAGIDLAAAYPGTPSSEVLESLWAVSKQAAFYVEWSTNEKVALEVVAGASVAGARALCAMKNAGLNVAMDTFATLPYSGVRGGMVVVVADDPGAHYSSTEQDTRLLAEYAGVPCLEPSDQEEARDMTKEAFALSEAIELPIMVRSVTRLSHASGDVLLKEISKREQAIGFNKHYKIPFRWNVYGTPGAVSKHKWLHGALRKASLVSEASPFNSLKLIPGARLGVIASGLGFAYVKDILFDAGIEGHLNLLKIGFMNPVPRKLVEQLLDASETVLVIEEGDSYLERHARTMQRGGVKILGRTDEGQVFEPWGELTPDLVRIALARALADVGNLSACEALYAEKPDVEEGRQMARELVIPRSSTLCPGCPHLGSYWALKQALRSEPGVHIVNGDIGCYEQGGYGLFGQDVDVGGEVSRKHPIRTPYEILDTLYVMGSGIGMAQGQAHLKGIDGKVIAVSGDGTFFHAVLPSIANAALTRANVTYLVLDNRWTAMTGHQPSPTTGADQAGDPILAVNIEQVVRALGVQRVFKGSVFDLGCIETILREALKGPGPTVVILEGECTLQMLRRKETKPSLRVDREKCTGCKTCVQLGCSGVTYDSHCRLAGIDEELCTGCGLCAQVCPVKAIGGGGSDN